MLTKKSIFFTVCLIASFGIAKSKNDLIKLEFVNACINNDEKKAIELIENKSVGVDEEFDLFESKKVTPLHVACIFNLKNLAQLLINKGAYINLDDNKGNTPIMHAVETENVQLVKLLLEYGAYTYLKNNKNETVFDYANKIKNEKIKEKMLKLLNLTKEFIDACKTNNEKKAIEMVNNGDIKVNHIFNYDVLYTNITPLHLACLCNLKELAKLLIDKGANICAKSKYYKPLYCCCLNEIDDIEILEMLLKNIPDTNIRRTYINELPEKDYLSRALLPSTDDETPLIITQTAKNINKARFLIENGADVNLAGCRGKTAIMHAVINENIEMVKLLLAYGANINSKNIQKYTVFDFAENIEDKDIKEKMLKLLNSTKQFDVCIKTGEFFDLTEKEQKDKDLLEFKNSLAKSKRADLIREKYKKSLPGLLFKNSEVHKKFAKIGSGVKIILQT